MGRGFFVHVQLLRGLDAPAALFWVKACSGFVQDNVERLAKGTLTASLRPSVIAIAAFCACIARFHPAMVQGAFGSAALLAARFATWRLRRACLLNRNEHRRRRDAPSS